MEARQFVQGEVWREVDGTVIVAVAQVHGGRVLLCRPSCEETAEEAMAAAVKLHNLRVKPLAGRRVVDKMGPNRQTDTDN
jgi:hypothetical protein